MAGHEAKSLGGLGIAEAVTHLLRWCSATSTALRRRLGSLCRGHLLCELLISSVICSLYHAVCLCYPVALLLCLLYVLRVPVLVEMTWWRG